MPVACRRSISAQSGGAEHVISVAVSFSTQRNAGMSSLDPSRIPAWLAPVCEERSVSHSVRRCVSSASQRAIVRGVAVAHRAAQHRQRQPVDLQEDDPGDVGVGDDSLPARDPLRDAQRVRVIRAEQDGEHDAHGGDHERRQQRPAEAVDGEHPVGQVVGHQQDHGVRDQDEQEAEHERERQPQRGEHGRDDRVQRRDDRRDDQRTPEALDADTGQQPGRHHQRDAHGKPRDDQREHPPNADARAATPWIGRTSARSRWASRSPSQSVRPRRTV